MLRISSSSQAIKLRTSFLKDDTAFFQKKFSKEVISNTQNEKNKDKKLMKAAIEMESIFTKMLFKQMKKNVFKSSFFKGGFGEEIFDDFLTEEYAKKSSETKSFDIANQVYNQLSRYI